MITLKRCPVCGSPGFTEIMVCKDYTVSKEYFKLVICEECSFKFTNPRPADEDLGSYYESADYISHSNTKKGFISKAYHFVRAYTLKKKLSVLGQYVSRGTILDYGCGTGMFLNACTEAGWKSYGMEPDPGARKIAAKKSKLISASLGELVSTEIMFDAITLWHVLEHVTDLDATLEFFRNRLKRGGVLVIAVPNHRSFDAIKYGQFWAAYDVPRHLYHFSVDTVSKLLNKFGFNLIHTHPMKFDSFYVSMLSEKNRSGSVSYFRAIWSGLWSNYSARKSKEYSSRIYIFKHQ